jgi:hypothetical protein
MSRINCKVCDGAGGQKPASFGPGWDFWGDSKTAQIRVVASLRDLPPRSDRNGAAWKSRPEARSGAERQAGASRRARFCWRFPWRQGGLDDGGTRLCRVVERGRTALPTTALRNESAWEWRSTTPESGFGRQFGTKTALSTTALRDLTGITTTSPSLNSFVMVTPANLYSTVRYLTCPNSGSPLMLLLAIALRLSP